MAEKHSSTVPPRRAVAYVRMSTGHQEKSPRQQRVELEKLAEREGCKIVQWYDQDLGITGDSGPERRPDFGRMLEAARRRQFDVLLAWDTKRIGRFDSLDAGKWLSVLRDAGITITTCCDGKYDLNDQFDRMKLGWSAEGNHSENISRAAACTRGMIDVAKRGFSCGGVAHYAMDRAQYDGDGNFVKRLAPGQVKDRKDHFVGPVLCEDERKHDAVRYIFKRYTDSDIGTRALAVELRQRGYPAPGSGPWLDSTVWAILRNPVYCGRLRWGARTLGRYFTVDGDTPTRRPRKDMGLEQKPDGAAIMAEAPCEPLVSPKLFERAQQKLKRRSQKRRARAEHPLSDLVHCQHCGKPMHFVRRRWGPKHDRRERPEFMCSTFGRFGAAAGCRCYHVPAPQVTAWLVRALQEVFLGPGREQLVSEIRRQLDAKHRHADGDTTRLRKRLAELDGEIDRLRKAVRKIDDDGLVEDLSRAKGEREEIAGQLSGNGRLGTAADIVAEAERIADLTWDLGERLSDADPANLRELFQRMVSRIECRFEQTPLSGGRVKSELSEGHVTLKRHELFVSRTDARASARFRDVDGFTG